VVPGELVAEETTGDVPRPMGLTVGAEEGPVGLARPTRVLSRGEEGGEMGGEVVGDCGAEAGGEGSARGAEAIGGDKLLVEAIVFCEVEVELEVREEVEVELKLAWGEVSRLARGDKSGGEDGAEAVDRSKAAVVSSSSRPLGRSNSPSLREAGWREAEFWAVSASPRSKSNIKSPGLDFLAAKEGSEADKAAKFWAPTESDS